MPPSTSGNIANVVAGPAECAVLDQVARIVSSRVFRGSETLRVLLTYLAKRTLDNPGEAIRGREIAGAVFKRSENFDSQADSIVRVHTGRLRSRLAEYYAGEGSRDNLVISIPKGTYMVASEVRQVEAAPKAVLHIETAPLEPVSAVPANQTRPRFRAWPVWLFVIAILTVSAGAINRFGRGSGPSTSAGGRTALRSFWEPFVESNRRTLLVLPGDNAAPVGWAEVDSAVRLTGSLAQLGLVPSIAHASELPAGSAGRDNLIWIGDPAQYRGREFEIRKSGSSLSIVNLHPRPGEMPAYGGSGFDYSVLAFSPPRDRGSAILSIAGLTPSATVAAAEYVSDDASVDGFLNRLGTSRRMKTAAFEVILRSSPAEKGNRRTEPVVIHPTE